MLRPFALRCLAALALVCGLVGLGAGPATAAGEIGLSTDGVTWGSALPGPLFDPSFRWVPGDVKTATFYVRDEDPDAAVLDVTMLTGPVESLIETGDITVGASVDGGPFVEATTAGSHLLVDQVPVASGQVRKIDVRVSFDPDSTNQSQLLRFDLQFTVQLSQDASVLPPSPSPSDGGTGVSPPGGNGSGDLPNTGTVITPSLLALSALLISGGLFLVGAARRGRREVQR